ncbi:MAG: rhomboid family intramembrane serine protease [Clostridiales bacterium]
MDWISILEKKYKNYVLKDLVKIIVIITIFVFFTNSLDKSNSIIPKMLLVPEYVLNGQVWRLITFIFIPESSNPLFVILSLYLFYIFGKSLEQLWGNFRFNLYYFIGIFSAIIAGFITKSGEPVFLNLSVFLAFAYLYPHYKLMVFFIIPVKIKYVAWFYLFFVTYSVIFSKFSLKIAAVLSFSNFIVFFGKKILDSKIIPLIKAFHKKQKRRKFKVIVPNKEN